MKQKNKVKVDPNKVIKTEPKLIKENFPKQGKKFGIQNKMKIILLIGKTYQVVNDSESTVFFQGTKMECLEYFYGITTQRKLI